MVLKKWCANLSHTDIHLSMIFVTFFNTMSDVEDTFCVLCGRDPCVWDIDKSTVTYLFNARYLGVKVDGSLVERKNAQVARRF